MEIKIFTFCTFPYYCTAISKRMYRNSSHLTTGIPSRAANVQKQLSYNYCTGIPSLAANVQKQLSYNYTYSLPGSKCTKTALI